MKNKSDWVLSLEGFAVRREMIAPVGFERYCRAIKSSGTSKSLDRRALKEVDLIQRWVEKVSTAGHFRVKPSSLLTMLTRKTSGQMQARPDSRQDVLIRESQLLKKLNELIDSSLQSFYADGGSSRFSLRSGRRSRKLI